MEEVWRINAIDGGFILALASLVIVVGYIVVNTIMSHRGKDDVTMAAESAAVIKANLSNLQKAVEDMDDCTDEVKDLRQDLTAAKRDVVILENARDAQDVRLQEVIERMADLGKRFEESVEQNEKLLKIAFNYIQYQNVIIEENNIEADGIPKELRDWIDERENEHGNN